MFLDKEQELSTYSEQNLAYIIFTENNPRWIRTKVTTKKKDLEGRGAT